MIGQRPAVSITQTACETKIHQDPAMKLSQHPRDLRRAAQIPNIINWLSHPLTCYYCHYLLLPATTCYHLLPHAITCCYLLLPATTCYYLLQPATTCYHLLPPATLAQAWAVASMDAKELVSRTMKDQRRCTLEDLLYIVSYHVTHVGLFIWKHDSTVKFQLQAEV